MRCPSAYCATSSGMAMLNARISTQPTFPSLVRTGPSRQPELAPRLFVQLLARPVGSLRSHLLSEQRAPANCREVWALAAKEAERFSMEHPCPSIFAAAFGIVASLAARSAE